MPSFGNIVQVPRAAGGYLPFEQWDRNVKERFAHLDFKLPNTYREFSGRVSNAELNTTCLSTIMAGPIGVIRKPSHIAAETEEHFVLKILHRGRSSFSQRGREIMLDAGDFALFTSAEPSEMVFPDAHELLVVSIPGSVLRRYLSRPETFFGRKYSGLNTANALFVQFARTLCSHVPALPQPVTQRLESNLLDMLITVLMADHGAEPVRVDTRARTGQIKAFIDQNLCHAHLGPGMIASHLGVSKRNLHLLFQAEETTVARYIRHQRLLASRRCLENEAYRSMSITDIAFRYGFSDTSHFSRAFRRQFGVSPSQVRSRVPGLAEAPA